jgi:hypothetical protein
MAGPIPVHQSSWSIGLPADFTVILTGVRHRLPSVRGVDVIAQNALQSRITVPHFRDQ